MVWQLGWHWIGTLAMILFWALIIVLALAPINYLRAQLEEEQGDSDGGKSDSPRR